MSTDETDILHSKVLHVAADSPYFLRLRGHSFYTEKYLVLIFAFLAKLMEHIVDAIPLDILITNQFTNGVNEI